MTELSLNVSRIINAPAEAIYKAWLDADMLVQFMLPADSVKTIKADNEPKVGGKFNIIMQTDEQDIPHSGEYKVLQPYTDIVFTWVSPFSIEGSTVTLKLTEVAAGTQLDLTHERFPNEESRNNHKNGWTAILAALDDYLSKQAVA